MLKQFIQQQVQAAFLKAYPNLPSDFVAEITPSTHSHYQCNSALKLSKLLQSSPKHIAEAILGQISHPDIQAQVAGPGFINLTLSNAYLTNCVRQLSHDPKLGVKSIEPERVIVDFSSPNVAKEMHVGHLRSTIIGDALARILTFMGHEVIRLNHVGDWGTAFGMLIHYLDEHPHLVNQIDLSGLVQAYKLAKRQFDEDAQFKKQAQLAVVSLQQGDAKALRYWRQICDISRIAYQAIYDLLGIDLIERGESFYNPWLAEIILDLQTRQLLVESDGAWCLFLPGFLNREQEPLPFLLQKSDGGYNYATTDLAAIRYRVFHDQANRIIYVTDAGQAQHFAMLFAAARLAGYLPANVRVDHVPFGLVLGSDNKKFKSRSGEVERLIDLVTTAITQAATILVAKAVQDEQGQLAETLGINAIKYADLSGNRVQDYVFSYERMLKFEGNTAAFLMYAYVRIQGIKRKLPNATLSPIVLTHPSEVALALHVGQFAERLLEVAQDLYPHQLCDYLYHLADKFNAFFRDCRVEGTLEQGSRLALCELVARVLKTGLELLGLKTVERM